MKQNTSRRRPKSRLWAVEVDAHEENEAATILVTAADVHDALEAAERRHPELMRSGHGKAWLCDHAIFRPTSGRFEYKRLRAF